MQFILGVPAPLKQIIFNTLTVCVLREQAVLKLLCYRLPLIAVMIAFHSHLLGPFLINMIFVLPFNLKVENGPFSVRKARNWDDISRFHSSDATLSKPIVNLKREHIYIHRIAETNISLRYVLLLSSYMYHIDTKRGTVHMHNTIKFKQFLIYGNRTKSRIYSTYNKSLDIVTTSSLQH